MCPSAGIPGLSHQNESFFQISPHILLSKLCFLLWNRFTLTNCLLQSNRRLHNSWEPVLVELLHSRDKFVTNFLQPHKSCNLCFVWCLVDDQKPESAQRERDKCIACRNTRKYCSFRHLSRITYHSNFSIAHGPQPLVKPRRTASFWSHCRRLTSKVSGREQVDNPFAVSSWRKYALPIASDTFKRLEAIHRLQMRQAGLEFHHTSMTREGKRSWCWQLKTSGSTDKLSHGQWKYERRTHTEASASVGSETQRKDLPDNHIEKEPRGYILNMWRWNPQDKHNEQFLIQGLHSWRGRRKEATDKATAILHLENVNNGTYPSTDTSRINNQTTPSQHVEQAGPTEGITKPWGQKSTWRDVGRRTIYHGVVRAKPSRDKFERDQKHTFGSDLNG